MNRTRSLRPIALGLVLIAGCKDNTGTQLASDYDKNAQAKPAPTAPALAPTDATGKNRRADTPVPTMPPAQASAGPTVGGKLIGKIVEAFDAASYTYMRLTNKDGEVWAAISKTPVTVGQTLELGDIAWMQEFSSPTLNRKFDRIAFAGSSVLLKDGAEVAAGAPAGRVPATGMPNDVIHGGTPADGQGSHKPTSPHATGGASATVKPGDVEKLDGGMTIAELFAQKENLVGKTVRVRAKVVKANANILGNNWFHIQDGTGDADTNDITITSKDTAGVGDTVVVEGILGVNKDIGAGYFFPIIIEQAKVSGH